jgi:hypothetical protein
MTLLATETQIGNWDYRLIDLLTKLATAIHSGIDTAAESTLAGNSLVSY